MKKHHHNAYAIIILGTIFLSALVSVLTTIAVLNIKSDFIFDSWAKANKDYIKQEIEGQY